MNQEIVGGGIQKWQRIETDALTIPDESNCEEEANETMSMSQLTAQMDHSLY